MSNNKELTYKLLKKAEEKYELAIKHGESRKEKAALHAFRELHENNNPAFIYALNKLKYFPVTIEEFIEGSDFLNGGGNDPIIHIWPTLIDKLKMMNPDQLCGEAPIYETVMAGATRNREKCTF